MRLFMQSSEYVKLCQFADVTPHSNISCIRYRVNLKCGRVVELNKHKNMYVMTNIFEYV